MTLVPLEKQKVSRQTIQADALRVSDQLAFDAGPLKRVCRRIPKDSLTSLWRLARGAVDRDNRMGRGGTICMVVCVMLEELASTELLKR